MGSNFKLFGLKSLKKLVKKLIPGKNRDQPLNAHPPIPSDFSVLMENKTTYPPKSSNSLVSMENLNTSLPIPSNTSVLVENRPTHPPIASKSSVWMKDASANPLTSSKCTALIPCVFAPICQDPKDQGEVKVPPGKDQGAVMQPPGRDENKNLLNVSKVDELKMDVALWCYKWHGLGLDGMRGLKYGVPYGANTFRDVGNLMPILYDGNEMKIGWLGHIVSAQYN